MSKEREAELFQELHDLSTVDPTMHKVLELLRLRRERFRTQLERANDEVTRGHSLECADLIDKIVI
jgi:hypothetical protein